MYKLTIYREKKPSTYKDVHDVLSNHCTLMSIEEQPGKVIARLFLPPNDEVFSYLGLLVRAGIIDGFKVKKTKYEDIEINKDAPIIKSVRKSFENPGITQDELNEYGNSR